MPAEPIHIDAATARLMFLALEAAINLPQLQLNYDQREAACAACLHELTRHGAIVEFGPPPVDHDVINVVAIEEEKA